MKRRAITLLAIGCGLGLLGWRQQSSSPDQSSPQATVKSFLAALAAKNASSVAACVEGAQANASLQAMLTSDAGVTARMTAADVTDMVVEVNGDQAKVAAETLLKGDFGNNGKASQVTVSEVEIFRLQRRDDKWRIVPDERFTKALTQEASQTPRSYFSPLNSLVALAALPAAGQEIVNKARDNAIAASCLTNEKQIALGVLMYVQDYDEIFPRKNAPYNNQIMPYVKNPDIFRCPMDVKGTISYTLNANIQGASLAEIAAPAQTVLVYEGKNMQMEFRHNGKAAVCFLDGHAKLITPEEAKGVYWYAAGKTPGAKPQPKPKKAGKTSKKR